MRNVFRPGLIALLAVSTRAQLPLTPGDTDVVNRLFYQPPHQRELNCRVQVFKPFLDFAFRFEAGYTVRFPLREFEGEANTLYTFIHITPEGGKTTLLGESFAIPAIPATIRHEINLKRFPAEAELSGVFAMGEGTYHLDLLVIDGHRRAFQKSWDVTAAPHGKEKEATITMQPNSAGSAMVLSAQQNQKDGGVSDGLRLTVLMDAAPIQPWSRELHAWDRAFLLQSLATLLGHLPYSSVRLIAFNLDQQQEVFRRENFRRAEFPSLASALRQLELGTVSYRTLQNQQGSSQLLARLVNEEERNEKPPDAVIFLGPHNRIDQKVPREMLQLERTAPHFFYFEYFDRVGSDFPDTLHYLTNACNGTVLKLHTPAEFADGIRKMERLLLKENSLSTSPYSPARQLSSERTSGRQTGPPPPSSPAVLEEFETPSH